MSILSKLKFWSNTTEQPQPPTQRHFVSTPQPDSGPTPLQPQAHTGQNFLSAFNSKQSGGKTRYGLSQYTKHLRLDHRALRANSRVMVHDSPPARVINRRQTDSVVGTGLKLDPMPAFEMLGLTLEQAEQWADDVREKFNLWAKSKKTDLTGRNNFYQNTRLYQWMLGRDGEVFVRFTYSKDKELNNPLQISFIDPNQLNGDEWTLSSGPTPQLDGIIKDENGREIGYNVWIIDAKKPGSYKNVKVPSRDEKSGLPIMIHGYDPEYAGQSRGMPEMSHGIQDFENITDFDTATVKKMTNSASTVFTVHNKQQDPSDMDLSTLDSGGGAGLITTEDSESSGSGPTAIGVDAVVACQLPESTITEAGVNLLGGRQGDELKLIDSASPAENSGEYMESKFDMLAASISMPPEIAKMLFTNSHAASRGSLGLYETVKRIKINDIDSDFYSIVYETWMIFEIASGSIQAPGFSDSRLRDAWLNHVLRGEPLPDIDPFKTKQAIKLAADLGLTDLDTEAMNNNGSSGKANRAKLARQVPELTPVLEVATETKTETDEDEPDDDNNTDKE